MKPIKATVITLISAFFINIAQAQFHYQYFDGNDTIPLSTLWVELDTAAGNIWQIGKPQKSIFNSAATIPNALLTDTVNYYPVNNRSVFTSTFDDSNWNWGIMAVRWSQKLDLDTNDGAIVEISVDTGKTWENAFNNPRVYNFYGYDFKNLDTLSSGEFVFSGTDTTWRDIWLCYDLTWASQFGAVMVRFTLLTDSVASNHEGWMIDNMLMHRTFVHSVGNQKQTEYLKVYPNPTSEALFIEGQKVMGYHLIEEMILTDQLGRTVDTWKKIPTKFFIDTRKYDNGKYYLKVVTNVKTEVFTVDIKHK